MLISPVLGDFWFLIHTVLPELFSSGIILHTCYSTNKDISVVDDEVPIVGIKHALYVWVGTERQDALLLGKRLLVATEAQLLHLTWKYSHHNM
jgi:hypothetical protein